MKRLFTLAARERRRTFNPEAADPPWAEYVMINDPLTDLDRDANAVFFTRWIIGIIVGLILSIIVGMILLIAAIAIGAVRAHAHDVDGYWARLAAEGKAPPAEWWNALGSGKGPCCSASDGETVRDVDWTIQHEGQECKKIEADGSDYRGSYCVRLAGEWWLVPDAAVITEPNRYSAAVVWPVWATIVRDGEQIKLLHDIRCFIPGAGT